MKLLVVFAAVFLVASALTDQEQWTSFKSKHNKVYKNLREEQLRFKIFQDNLRIIETHNAKYENGDESYFLGVNKFADLTNEEFRNTYLSKVPPPKTGATQVFYKAVNASAVPDAIDWTEKNAVLGVKDQGQCGSCWAFSTTGSVEGQNAIKHNKKVSLSEQQLVDCSSSYGNQGCNGGLMDYGFAYIKDHGISTEASYGYTAEDGSCKTGTSAGITLTGFTDVHASEASLKDAVGTVGPVSVAIFADLIQLYAGGIFDNLLCLGLTLDHGVLATGYGNANNKDFWIIKNSWGADWGESGYFRLVRNKFDNCGIAKAASYPTIQ